MRLYDARAVIGQEVNKLKKNRAAKLQQIKLEVDPILKAIKDKGQYYDHWAIEYVLKPYTNYAKINAKQYKLEEDDPFKVNTIRNINDAKKHILREYLDHTNYELMYLET